MIHLLVFALSLVVGAWGLPVAQWAARGWTRLYTRFVAPDQRDRRRQEIESDLFEQIEAERREGYRPGEIALKIMLRVVWGVADDVTWTSGRVTFFREWSQWDRVAAGCNAIGILFDLADLAWQTLDPVFWNKPVALFGVVLPSLVYAVPPALSIAFIGFLSVKLHRRVRQKLALASLNLILDDFLRIGPLLAASDPYLRCRLNTAAMDPAIPQDTRGKLTEFLAATRTNALLLAQPDKASA